MGLQIVDQAKHVGDRGAVPGRQLLAAEAPHVRPDHVEITRERLHLGIPHSVVGDGGVEQKDRYAGSVALVMESRAMDGRFHQINAVSRALNFKSVSSSSRAGSESGITPTPA